MPIQQCSLTAALGQTVQFSHLQGKTSGFTWQGIQCTHLLDFSKHKAYKPWVLSYCRGRARKLIHSPAYC